MIKVEYKTEQEQFWASDFGDEYINRNDSDKLISSNVALFEKVFSKANAIDSVIEFGANIGNNLVAIREILPNSRLAAVEINQNAAQKIKDNLSTVSVFNQSIDDYLCAEAYDLSFTKGVLIHLNPNQLAMAYSKLYESSSKYIMIAEYYSPVPAEINYRGHEGRLFKRDFAGEFLDQYSDCQLVDYGFVYHRDTDHPLDDITWFLIQKR